MAHLVDFSSPGVFFIKEWSKQGKPEYQEDAWKTKKRAKALLCTGDSRKL